MLTATGLTKTYGGVHALGGVDLTLAPGVIHGLLGENGAGKSTLVKILAGATRPDQGQVSLGGRAVRFASTADAMAQGVALVSQELNLFGDLDVLSNLFGARLPRRGPVVDRRRMTELARPVLDELGLDLDPRVRLAELSLAQQQLVEIARALISNPQVLILDEPTSALQPAEAGALHAILRRLGTRGDKPCAICYVSHTLEDVLDVCDEVTVLRDGKVVLASEPTAGLSMATLVTSMLGEQASEQPVAAGKPELTQERLRLLEITVPGSLDDVTVEAGAGEIVGLAGLAGSGHRDLLAVAAGLLPPARGRVELPGGKVLPPGVRRAVRHGVGLVSGDRRRLGLMIDKPLWENVVQVCAVGVGGRPVLRAKQLRALASKHLDRLGVRAASVDQSADQLSGGNQQKVVFAKWLAARPKVLLLDDPTRGVDVGAKAEVHRLMRELAGQGVVQLVVSSEPQELAGVCDRVIVIHRGRVSAQLSGDRLTAHEVLRAANGEPDENSGDPA